MAKDGLKFDLSGEISPNLVILVTASKVRASPNSIPTTSSNRFQQNALRLTFM